jgi:hypothetical protein
MNCERRFYPSAPLCRSEGATACLTGRLRRQNGIEGRSRGFPGLCRRSFRLPFSPARSIGRSYPRRRGSQSNPIGERIPSALIVWHALWRLALALHRDGHGEPAKAGLGWHKDLWNAGPNKNAVWHCACVVAWQFWNAPNSEAALLRRLQGRRCGQTGGRLWKSAEVDHRVPLFRVWSEHRDLRWPKLLDFWGLPNLQVINRDVHAAKCAIEARDRRAARSLETELR